MEKKKHSEEYEETRDGAITYLTKDLNNDVITMYQNSSNPFTRQSITVLINQRDSQKKVLLNSMQEFDKLKASIENEIGGNENKKNDIEIKEKINSQGDGEAVINIEEIEDLDGKNSNDGEDTSETAEDKDVDNKIQELEEMADEMEKMKENYLDSENSLKNMKGVCLKNSVVAGVMLEARARYERAQDMFNYETAKHMIEKNILVAKREAVILEINRAIGRGDNLDGLQDNLIDLNNKITDLDQDFNNLFPTLQAEVESSREGLKTAQKEVTKTVRADFRNSYKQIQQYSEEGILKSEVIDMNKNMNRFLIASSYDDNIISNGKNGAIETQTINIEGKVVRVLTQETSMGVNTSFMDGNIEHMSTGVGQNNNYVTRDSNGNLIADNPELKDALKRIGIESIEDIGTICEEMDQKAEERDAEEIDEGQEFPDPSLQTSDEG